LQAEVEAEVEVEVEVEAVEAEEELTLLWTLMKPSFCFLALLSLIFK
jgi:hypothetical protein